jgi:hypothetical protein
VTSRDKTSFGKLAENFTAVTEGCDLPPLDLSIRLAGVEAFLQVAEKEPKLAVGIQTTQLRDATRHLRDLAKDVSVIRQAVELVGTSTGEVTAGGNMDTGGGDIITGTQINHIVNYQVKPRKGTPTSSCIPQAFFPDKSVWNKPARALKGVVDEERFAALSGTASLPFPAGKYRRAAVKVIDPRGNEVMRVHHLGTVQYEGKYEKDSPS